MAKNKIINEASPDTGEEKKSPIKRNDDLYKRPIKVQPVPPPKLGMDVDQEFYDTLIAAAQQNSVDIGKLESFTQITQTRDQIYSLIDTMAEDSTIAAVLETYAEDATEPNMDGRIVWATADDDNTAKYITYLMDTMNIDKNVYSWIYSLIKYGDLYLRLYRESEYNDKLFDKDEEEEQVEDKNTPRVINESVAKVLENDFKDGVCNSAEISKEDAEKLDDLDEEFSLDKNTKELLNEDLIVKVFSQNDRYVHYMEAIPNPAEIYELTRLGKSYAYIQAPVVTSLKQSADALQYNNRYIYSFKKRDVSIFESTEFVHACLQDNSSRTPEEVKIFLTDSDYDSKSNSLNYKVRRGQSLLYSAYKIWREMMLLEYSLLLNRVTKSSVVRIVGVEVGDMPKEQIGPHLQGIKSLMEQKSALNVGEGMSEYTNPGPIENNIYVPTHNQIGAISTQTLGGDVDVKGIADIDYFTNKLFGCLRGNTQIKLTDGTCVSVEDAYKDKSIIGKKTTSCNSDGTTEEAIVTDVMLTNKEAKFIRFTLEDGSYIDVTPEHKMMLANGTFKLACELTEEDELMSI